MLAATAKITSNNISQHSKVHNDAINFWIIAHWVVIFLKTQSLLSCSLPVFRIFTVLSEQEHKAWTSEHFTSEVSGPCQSESNQYWLISQISVISILYSPGTLHFMNRLPLKTWAYVLSRQCLTWPFKLIMCQNYLMLNATGSILTLEIKFTPQ